MDIQFLGTGAGMPSKQRNVSSMALKLLDERNEIWLFDCGEGTQQQILETRIKPRKITKIFITHMHGDHIYGLPGLLSSRTFQSSEEQTSLEIYGPPGIKEFINMTLKISGVKLGYKLSVIEIAKDSAAKIFEDETFEVYQAPLDHTIYCMGYRIVQKDQVGELDAQALKEAGVPFGPLFGRIKAGEDITLDNGQVLHAKDFIGNAKQGKIVTILGDTRKSNASVHLALGADLLVHEATYEASLAKIARNHGHSTTVEAGQVAKEAQVKRLLLTHISSRYLGPMVSQMAQEAKSVFANSHIVKDFYEETID